MKTPVETPIAILAKRGRRGPPTFRQGDLTRALKGARQAGQVPTRAEIDRDGKISLTFGDEQPPSSARDWDEALSNDR
jgi:hypothetical protein